MIMLINHVTKGPLGGSKTKTPFFSKLLYSSLATPLPVSHVVFLRQTDHVMYDMGLLNFAFL